MSLLAIWEKIPPHFHDFKVKSKRKISLHSFQMKITVFTHAVHTSNHRWRGVRIPSCSGQSLSTFGASISCLRALQCSKNVPAPLLLQVHFSVPTLHLQTQSPTEWAYYFQFMLTFFSPQVANLACSISNNEEGVKLVRMAATQIDSLCPQVSINP